MANHTPEQPRLFPDETPDFVVRYWKAVWQYYKSGTRSPPVREVLLDIYNALVPVGEKTLELRTFDRKRAEHKLWIGPWPPSHTASPPWESRAAEPPPAEEPKFNVVPDEIHTMRRIYQPAIAEGGEAVMVVQVYDIRTGNLIRQYLDHGVAAIFTGIFLWGMLDILADGRLDGIAHICRMVVTHVTLR